MQFSSPLLITAEILFVITQKRFLGTDKNALSCQLLVTYIIHLQPSPSVTIFSIFVKNFPPLVGPCPGEHVQPSSALYKSTVSFSDLQPHHFLVCRQLMTCLKIMSSWLTHFFFHPWEIPVHSQPYPMVP